MNFFSPKGRLTNQNSLLLPKYCTSSWKWKKNFGFKGSLSQKRRVSKPLSVDLLWLLYTILVFQDQKFLCGDNYHKHSHEQCFLEVGLHTFVIANNWTHFILHILIFKYMIVSQIILLPRQHLTLVIKCPPAELLTFLILFLKTVAFASQLCRKLCLVKFLEGHFTSQ